MKQMHRFLTFFFWELGVGVGEADKGAFTLEIENVLQYQRAISRTHPTVCMDYDQAADNLNPQKPSFGMDYAE